MSSTTVLDRTGTAKVLGPLLARGGEGEVFALSDRAEVLVKCYHPEVLDKRGPQLQAKTEAMIELAAQFRACAVSWPTANVYNPQRRWIGYAMRRASGVPVARLAHAVLYQKSFPQLDRVRIVGYLRNLLRAVDQLHRMGVRVGDYNFNNILCDTSSERVTLIDCDSYQLEHNGKVYPCPVGSPDMTPREHHGQAFERVYRTPQSECFSVAIVMFKCLMLGRHPYDIVGGEDPVSNLKSGRFAYGRGNTGVPQGPWYNIWSHMPHRLKDMFITTFTHGATDIAQRPTLAEWDETLELYLREMLKGWHEVAVQPSQPKSKAYRGSRSLAQV